MVEHSRSGRRPCAPFWSPRPDSIGPLSRSATATLHVTPDDAHAARLRAGFLYGVAAYAWWGLVPAYFKLVAHVPAPVVLGHRVLWSVVLLVALLTLGGRWPEVRAVARVPRVWPWLAASTVFIAVNWLVFIYAVASGRLIEASLGYFINPLVMVVLGMLFLGERLRPAQWAAAVIAGAGVVYLTIASAGLPWIAVVLPISFGLYSLIRKRAPVGPLAGLFIETALLAPLAAAYVAWAHFREGAPGGMNTPGTVALLSLAGIITTLPLLWFVAAARRLPLVSMGFLQYISPSLQFLTAVLVFGEPFGRDRVVAFILIWVALGLFILDSLQRRRSAARAERQGL